MAIAEALKENTTLKTLVLRCNGLYDDDDIMQALKAAAGSGLKLKL